MDNISRAEDAPRALNPRSRTAQAVPAGLAQRTQAFLYDYVLILLYIAGLAAVFVPLWLGPLHEPLSGLSPIGADVLAFVTLVLPVTLYFAVGDASSHEGTWGKRRVGLRVQTVAGGRIGTGRSLVRSALKFVPWQISHTALFNTPDFTASPLFPPDVVVAMYIVVYLLIGANVIAAFRTRHRQSLYDMAAGTTVVTCPAT